MDESVDYLDAASTAPGGRLGSNYLVGELLGRGAMGVVHEGETLDGGPVAIKFLRAELAADHQAVARFLQERHIFRQIEHTNVVRVHDLVAEGDALAIVMERVPGGDLKHRIDDGSLTARQAMAVAADVAAGLAAIHQVKVVHRDLKPANILLTDDLVPKISDFGISRLVTEAMSRSSSAIGTPIYMAPEAADQRGAQAPSDVYALGVMMFEMLVGRPPFAEGGTFAILRAHAMDPPPRVDGVPRALAKLIDRMMAKDPAARPPADDVRRRLLDLLPDIEDYLRPVAVTRVNGGPDVDSSELPGPRSNGTQDIGDPNGRAPLNHLEHGSGLGGAVGAAGIAAVSAPAAASGETRPTGGPWTSDEPSWSGRTDRSPSDPSNSSQAMIGSPPGFSGLQDPASANGSSASPPVFDGVPQASGMSTTSFLPLRVNRRLVEVVVAVVAVLAVIGVAALVVSSRDGDGAGAVNSDGSPVTVEADGPGASQVGDPDGTDGAGFSRFGGSGGDAPTGEGDSDESGSDADETGRTGTTEGSSTRTAEGATEPSSATTEPASPSTQATTSTTQGGTTSAPSTATSPSSTTETTSSTATTVSTTSSTIASQPIQIQPGSVSSDSIGPMSFHFSYRTNDVCGTGSFSVYEQATNALVGSFSGANVCYGPEHGGFPGHSSFPGFNLQPNTTYRVAITVKGSASDGSKPAGTGQATTSLLVTTSS